MYFLKVLYFLFVLSAVNCKQKQDSSENNLDIHEDVGLDIYKYLRKYGYPTQTHWVQTEDGYILRMQRLVRKNGAFSEVKNKPAVLLMHGLLSSSMDFVNMGSNKSLGLVLADAGFDVWLGNNRGNTWSRQHVTLNPDTDAKFWDYSFETCGYYDLPAKIDYIIKETGQQKIFYVGHSQGTTQFFAMAALRPEYNDKIALMSALAPVAYMKHLSSPLPRLMAKYMELLEFGLTLLGWNNEILRYSPIITEVAKLACSDNLHSQEICAIFLFTLCGYNSPGLNRTLIPVLASNAPAGISLKMLIHYGQEIRSGYFRRYDYGILNIKHYKSLKPPNFNISAITVPIALYYSQNDLFAAVQDVERLAMELPNVVKKRLIEKKLFNHLDYIFSKDTNDVINMDLLNHLQEFIKNGTTSKANIIYVGNSVLVLLLITLCTTYLQ